MIVFVTLISELELLCATSTLSSKYSFIGPLPNVSINSKVGTAAPRLFHICSDSYCTRKTAGAMRGPAARKIAIVATACDAYCKTN